MFFQNSSRILLISGPLAKFRSEKLMNTKKVVSAPLVHFDIFLGILPLEQMTSELFNNSSQNSDQKLST